MSENEEDIYDKITNEIWKGIEECFPVDDTIWMPNRLSTTLWEYINHTIRQLKDES